jgi:hypothetical protein
MPNDLPGIDNTGTSMLLKRTPDLNCRLNDSDRPSRRSEGVRRLVPALIAGLVAASTGAQAETGRTGPCAAFAPDAPYVTSYVIRPHEGGKVRLRVPIQYFEDPWDRVDGFEDTSQLFSVDMKDFSPVTRPDTAVRNRAKRFDYMWFTVSDWISMETIVQIMADLPRGDDLTGLPADREGPEGLAWLATDHSSTSAFPIDDVFLGRDAQGAVRTAIKCSSPNDPTKTVPICKHYFHASGLDVNLSYPRLFLDNWASTQADIEQFLNCATKE